jgi:hypothetical protein
MGDDPRTVDGLHLFTLDEVDVGKPLTELVGRLYYLKIVGELREQARDNVSP